MELITDAVEDYFANSSMHGLRFIGKRSGNHWTERLFWAICCILCWCGSILLLLSSYDAYLNNPISFVISTSYKDWHTHFPSVSVCENENNAKSKMFAEQYLGQDDIYNKLGAMNEIAYFLSNMPLRIPYLQKICKRKWNPVNCSSIDMVSAARMIRSSCEETFERCQWNEVEFDCCTYFLQLETELGLCYSINNIQTKEPKFINLSTNWSTGSSTLLLQLKTSATVYIHARGDVPNLNVKETDEIAIKSKPGDRHEIYFTIHETENSDGVENVHYTKRKCKFPWETQGSYYPQYSYSACIVECRLHAQLELCNCTSHLMAHVFNGQSENEGRICAIDDLLCVRDNFGFLSNLEPLWSPGKDALKCSCFSGCEEIQIDEIINRKSITSDESKSYIQLQLYNLPSEIFRRTVVRNKLDLAVSMGSAVGLFVGASLLSLVEFIYYFTFRLRLRRQRPADLGTKRHRRRKITLNSRATVHFRPWKNQQLSVGERNAQQNRKMNFPPLQPFLN